MNEETIIALTAGSILVTKLHTLKELLEGMSMETHEDSHKLTSLRDALEECVTSIKAIAPAVYQLDRIVDDSTSARKRLLEEFEALAQEHPAIEDSAFAQTMRRRLSVILGGNKKLTEINKHVLEAERLADHFCDDVEHATDRLESDSDTLMEMASKVSTVVSHMPLPPMEHENFDTAFKRIFGTELADETMFMHRIQRSA